MLDCQHDAGFFSCCSENFLKISKSWKPRRKLVWDLDCKKQFSLYSLLSIKCDSFFRFDEGENTSFSLGLIIYSFFDLGFLPILLGVFLKTKVPKF